MKTRLKWLRNLAGSLGLLAVLFLGWAGWMYGHGNYHRVLSDVLYRSGQLTATQLQWHIQQDSIRSILNLRGAAPQDKWYRQELAVARRDGVNHTDVDLSASKPLDVTQMHQLIGLMRKLPKPLLIHCEGGADRTGLAVALYLYAIKGDTAQQAARQLAARYGHLPYLFHANVAAMDNSFRHYVNTNRRPG